MSGLQSATQPIDPATFRVIAGHWVTGVAVVTTVDAAGNPYGLTVSAVSSLSIEPIQFLVCVDNRSESLPALMESGLFCINYLSDKQQDLSKRFARKISSKFADLSYRRLPNGLPLLEGGLGFVACRVAAVFPGGDHQIIIGQVEYAEASGEEPLVYFRGGYRRLSPLN